MSPEPTANLPLGMTRREAMLQLLRLGGAATATAGAAAWLSRHSIRPIPEIPEPARRDHRSFGHFPMGISAHSIGARLEPQSTSSFLSI